MSPTCIKLPSSTVIVVSPIAAEASATRLPLIECGPKAVELVHIEIFKLFPNVPASLAINGPMFETAPAPVACHSKCLGSQLYFLLGQQYQLKQH